MEVLEALERRLDLFKNVDLVIINNFERVKGKYRLKREPVQRFIMKKLRLTRTTSLCVIINERMLALGMRPSLSLGYRYFNNIKIKKKEI
jgi:hypothetical protein